MHDKAYIMRKLDVATSDFYETLVRCQEGSRLTRWINDACLENDTAEVYRSLDRLVDGHVLEPEDFGRALLAAIAVVNVPDGDVRHLACLVARKAIAENDRICGALNMRARAVLYIGDEDEREDMATLRLTEAMKTDNIVTQLHAFGALRLKVPRGETVPMQGHFWQRAAPHRIGRALYYMLVGPRPEGA